MQPSFPNVSDSGAQVSASLPVDLYKWILVPLVALEFRLLVWLPEFEPQWLLAGAKAVGGVTA